MSPSRPLRGSILLWVAALASMMGCGGLDGPPPLEGDHDVTIFHAHANLGNIEPCACNNRTVGGFPRRFALLKELRKTRENVLVVEGGNTFFSEKFAAKEIRPQHREKARAIAKALLRCQVEAMTLGELDLSHGGNFLKELVRDFGLPMIASNVRVRKTGEPLFEEYKIISKGGLKIAVLGLINPELKRIVSQTNEEGTTMTQLSKDEVIIVEELFEDRDVEVEEPIEAAKDLVRELRGQAHLIVVLSHLPPKMSRDLPTLVPGIDVVIGAHLPSNRGEYKIAGRSLFLRTPMNGTVIGVADFHVEDGGLVFADHTELHRYEATLPNLEKARQEVIDQYHTDDPEVVVAADADAAERLKLLNGAIEERRAKLEVARERTESYFIHDAISLDGKEVKDDPAIQELVREYRRSLGRLYEDKSAPVDPVVKPIAGTQAYTTESNCVICHKPQTEFWERTHHANAWQTMLDQDAQFDLECIVCHTVGYMAPGGFDRPDRVAGHEDVQCENCHGPGSFHIDGVSFLDRTKIIGDADQMGCESCHNHEHSPDFDRKTFVSRVACPPIDPHEPLIRGAIGRARQELDRTLAKPDASPRFYQAAIDLDLRLLNYEAALDIALKGLEQHPGTVRLEVGAAWALDGLGRTAEAIARLHQEYERNPTEQLVWKELAKLLIHGRDESARDLGTARELISFAVRDFGAKDPTWHLLLAELRHAEGDLEGALGEINRIVLQMGMRREPYTDLLESWTNELAARQEFDLPPPLPAAP